jgi:cytochrome c553
MMAKTALANWLVLVCLAFTDPALAQDAKAGRQKAKMCAICHGINGIAEAPNAPNLAGENAAYIISQLKAFKSGKRTHEQMSIIAAELEDSEIKDLARWYSLIKIVATPPDLD